MVSGGNELTMQFNGNKDMCLKKVKPARKSDLLINVSLELLVGNLLNLEVGLLILKVGLLNLKAKLLVLSIGLLILKAKPLILKASLLYLKCFATSDTDAMDDTANHADLNGSTCREE